MVPGDASEVSWPRRVSLRSRLSALAAAAVGMALVVAAITIYVSVQHALYDQVDSDLAGQANQISQAVSQSQPGSLSRALRNLSGGNAEIITNSGSVLIVSPFPAPDIPGHVSLISRAQLETQSPGWSSPAPSKSAKRLAANGEEGNAMVSTESGDGTQWRVYTIGLGPQTLQSATGPIFTTGMAIAIFTPLNVVHHSLTDLRLILLLVLIGGIGLAVLFGYLVARAMTRPVERLTEATERVATTQSLDAHIDEVGNDEIARLSHSFNTMLNALGASRQQQAQLVADAGHELRTPLTSLRTNIELLMRTDNLPAADRSELLADISGQLEELTTLVGDLVEMARQDEVQPEPVEVSLADIVERAVERAQRRAPGLTFAVSTEPGVVQAQPGLLERAVLNVLDNAAKFSPPDGSVEVTLRKGSAAAGGPAPPAHGLHLGHRDEPPADAPNPDDGVWLLDVRDHGPGISSEDIGRVFDRFYRSTSARALPGSGLGLAIVRQVFRAHGGDAWITSAPEQGTLVHLELPVVPTEAVPELDEPRAGGESEHSSPDSPDKRGPVSSSRPKEGLSDLARVAER